MIKSLGKQYIFVPVTAIPLFKQNTLYVEYNTTFRLQLAVECWGNDKLHLGVHHIYIVWKCHSIVLCTYIITKEPIKEKKIMRTYMLSDPMSLTLHQICMGNTKILLKWICANQF